MGDAGQILIDAIKNLNKELEAAHVVEADDPKDLLARNVARKSLKAVLSFLTTMRAPVELIQPLLHLDLALTDVSEGRHSILLRPNTVPRNEQEGTSKTPTLRLLQSATAAAAITVLMEDCGSNLSDALKAASRATGVSEARIKNFRKKIMKGDVPDNGRQQYLWTIDRLSLGDDDRDQSKERTARILATVRKLVMPKRDLREEDR